MPLVLRFAGIWLIYCAWSIACGWMLSCIRELHYVGYGYCSIFLCVFVFIWWSNSKSKEKKRKISISRIKKYVSSPSRISWITVATLVMLAPMFYHPTNHDAVTYRLPRIYYWLQEESWYWIGGIGYRMDVAGTGCEWMSIPIILASRSDRLLFLLNILPYLMMPGLIYLAGNGVGLRPRVARWWMYVLPMAYGIVLQAGSIGNDFLGVSLSVTALAFAQASKKYCPMRCLSFSALAMLVMIGVKITTLPLLLPLGLHWVYQAVSCLSKKQILQVFVIISPAVILCSIIPISFLCIYYTGKWNGNPNNKFAMEVKDPIAGIIGNGMNFLAASFYPPVFPNAGHYSKEFKSWLDSMSWHNRIRVGNPSYTINLNHELPSEELAGIGFGLTTVVALWVFGSMKRKNRYHGRLKIHAKIYSLATLFALVFFLAKVSSGTTARLALPFIPHLVFSLILLFPQRRKMLSEFWTYLPTLCILPTLCLNPNRPLIPAELLKEMPCIPEGIAKRMEIVYRTYANRSNLLTSLVSKVPDGESLAFAGGADHPCNSIFIPLHRIRVMDLNENNFIDATWMIGTEDSINRRIHKSLEDLNALGFKVVTTQIITDKVVIGPEKWYLLKRCK